MNHFKEFFLVQTAEAQFVEKRKNILFVQTVEAHYVRKNSFRSCYDGNYCGHRTIEGE